MSPRLSPLVLLVLAAACAERDIPPPAASDARTGDDDKNDKHNTIAVHTTGCFGGCVFNG